MSGNITSQLTAQPLLRAALHYAALGLAVFPVPPGTKQSYKSAKHSGGRAWGMTNDADEVRRDWQRWPDAGIGIPTGAVNGIVVVETDTVEGHGVDGAASLAKLEQEFGPLPNTLQSCSPSGSIHRYFQHPGAGIKIKNSASEIGAGIDVRGSGGMVVAPPSRKLDGRPYRWLNKRPIMPMPPWLVGMTQYRAPEPRRPSAIEHHSGIGYGAAALKREIEVLAGTAPGGRNEALNRAAFNLFQLVASGELDAAEVERRLVDAATANGLVADDGIRSVLTTIRSGARAGMQSPRGRR